MKFSKHNLIWFIAGIFLAVLVLATLSLTGIYRLISDNSKSSENQTEQTNKENSLLPLFSDYLVVERGDDFWQSKTHEFDYSGRDWYKEVGWEADLLKEKMSSIQEGGPNFADHYIIFEDGCGTECKYILVIDAKTGKIIKPGISATFGFDYNPYSKLLVANPPAEIYGSCSRYSEGYMCKDYESRYYVWNDDHFDFLGAYNVSFDVKLKEKE